MLMAGVGFSDQSSSSAKPGGVGHEGEAVLLRDRDSGVGHCLLRPPAERTGGCPQVRQGSQNQV